MNAVSTAREALLSQLEPIEQQADELREKLDQLDETKAQLKAALKALTPSKKGKSKGAAKTSKPNAKKPDVRKVCLAVIKANPGISKDKLEERVKHHITKDLGFPLTAVAMLLRQCLSSDEFHVAADGTVSTTLAARVGAVNADPQRVEKTV